jgi:hypothetical protein
VLSKIPEEAIAAGWHPAERLFYERCYSKELEIPYFIISHLVPEEAIAFGFAPPQSLPYSFYQGPGTLIVLSYWPISMYPQEFVQGGWYPAIDLPYYHTSNGSLVVMFSTNTKNDNDLYKEAIAAGWYPAERLANKPQAEEIEETKIKEPEEESINATGGG